MAADGFQSTSRCERERCARISCKDELVGKENGQGFTRRVGPTLNLVGEYHGNLPHIHLGAPEQVRNRSFTLYSSESLVSF